MEMVKSIFQSIIKIFFDIYFSFFGKPKINSSMKKTLSLYKTGDFSEVFQTIRIWDAPYEVIDKIVPKKGIIVDLGCGDGLLANYIATSRPKTKVFGIDLNRERIKEAEKCVKNTKFVYGDILKKEIPKADVILVIHVFHHLTSKKAQEKLIEECYTKLKKSGKLIVAEVAEKPFLKYQFSWFTDHVIVPILFESKLYNPDIFFRRVDEWQKLFDKLGFNHKSIKADKSKPFSHVVFECTKK